MVAGCEERYFQSVVGVEKKKGVNRREGGRAKKRRIRKRKKAAISAEENRHQDDARNNLRGGKVFIKTNRPRSFNSCRKRTINTKSLQGGESQTAE